MDFGRCCRDYGLVQHKDKVMVGLSGGKDSFTLLHLMRRMQRRTPFSFEIVAVTVDQGQPGFSSEPIEAYMSGEDVPFHLVEQDTFSVVKEKISPGKTLCPLCARLRRGILYRVAREIGATKIALGHHRDDIIETFLLNVLYSGQTKAMPPRLVSDDGRHVVIRPLAYVSEADIARFAKLKGFPSTTCTDCGGNADFHREKVKRLIDELNSENPKVKGNLMAALANVVPSHLMDRDLLTKIGKPVPAITGGRTPRCYDLEAT